MRWRWRALTRRRANPINEPRRTQGERRAPDSHRPGASNCTCSTGARASSPPRRAPPRRGSTPAGRPGGPCPRRIDGLHRDARTRRARRRWQRSGTRKRASSSEPPGSLPALPWRGARRKEGGAPVALRPCCAARCLLSRQCLAEPAARLGTRSGWRASAGSRSVGERRRCRGGARGWTGVRGG